jgi:hypothetical protein
MRLATLLPLILAAGCSRPSSSSGEQPTVPAVALFVVSGHNQAFDGNPSTSYLQFDAGPEIVSALQSYGLTTWVGYFVDDAFSVEGYGGFLSLIQSMKWVRDHWSRFGTRVVVVAHSHGGVWANAAIESVPDLDVACQVNLDTSSYGWAIVGHDAQDGYIGGDPRDEFDIPYLTYYPDYPNVPSDQTSAYDLEDVVFSNVVYTLEVRSGDSLDGIEWFDEKWNIRVDGQVDGLYGYYSATSHEEVHQAGGTTLGYVDTWIVDRLFNGFAASSTLGSPARRLDR